MQSVGLVNHTYWNSFITVALKYGDPGGTCKIYFLNWVPQLICGGPHLFIWGLILITGGLQVGVAGDEGTVDKWGPQLIMWGPTEITGGPTHCLGACSQLYGGGGIFNYGPLVILMGDPNYLCVTGVPTY